MASIEQRRSLRITLPEFVVQALEHRVAEANQIDVPGQNVDFNDVVEWYLAGAISVRDVAVLDQQIPGFAKAVNKWLQETQFEF